MVNEQVCLWKSCVFKKEIKLKQTASMVFRLEKHLELCGKQYTSFALLAGTNDMNNRDEKQSQTTVNNLKRMVEMAIEHGCRSMCLMTLPPVDLAPDWFEKNRLATNELIRSTVTELSAAHSDRKIVCVDCAAFLTTKDLCDGLHLTPDAYVRVGDAVFKQLFEEPAATTTTDYQSTTSTSTSTSTTEQSQSTTETPTITSNSNEEN